MFAPAGMLRNRVPEWIRMGGRNQSESGAGLGRNLQSESYFCWDAYLVLDWEEI